MKKIFFKKLSGAGNDFVLIDRSENSGINLTPGLVSDICNRRTGIGADGILEIEDLEEYDFGLTYYNSDGYPGSLCGNGSRCAIKYAFLSNRVSGKHTEFFCQGEVYRGEVIDERNVKFFLKEPSGLRKNVNINIEDLNFEGDFIDTGSPHYVAEINGFDIDKFDVADFGEKLRYHTEFSPNGTNVNFVKVENDIVKIRTYERGVEDETLACGTGSVASALILFLNDKVKPPVKLEVLSGEKLIVDFSFRENKFADIRLAGPADIVFSGEYYLNN